MSINPNAVMTPGPPCPKCGQPITGYYVVLLCDECLEAAIPEKSCEVCGFTSKHLPRMTRFRDGKWQDDDGKPLPMRFFCADHAHVASGGAPVWEGDYA